VLRIVPLYLATLGLYALLYRFYDWRAAGLTGMFQLQLPVWSLLTFTQNIIPSIDGSWRGPGWLGVTWSLCVEEQFYLMLPALIRVVPLKRVPVLCLAAITIAPIFRISLLHVMPDNALAPYALLPSRMDALFLGVLAAWAWRDENWRARLIRWRRPLLGVFLLMTAALLLNLQRIGVGYKTQSIGYTVIAFYYCLGLMLSVSGPAARPWLARLRTPLCWAGLGAYSIYLFHRPVQGLVIHALGSDSGTAQLLSLVVITAVAYVCWHFIERPAIAFGHRTFQYAARQPTPLIEPPLAQPGSA
jgi:peptidoglycan/LPS O-acetylase OafA/YrhL